MSFMSLILLAFGLSMDAFAASVIIGSTLRTQKLSFRHLLGPFLFGVFQALMPLLGAFAGSLVRNLVIGFGHWIAFLLLVFVGGKMVYEALTEKEKDESILSVKNLFFLAVATSIDAFAAGVSFALLEINGIFIAVAIIGAVTFAVSMVALVTGKIIGHLGEERFEMAGGLVIIAIGLKILLENIL